MIILPDKNICRTKLLMPVPKKEWMPSSLAKPKDEFGNHTHKVLFVITAKLNDGHVCWRGHFEDRDDFDAFLWAIANGTLKYQKELWKLPFPNWHPFLDPSIEENITYHFATKNFLTSTGTNNYTIPVDFNNNNNVITCIGGGGGGGSVPSANTGAGGGGGGGGAWAQYSGLFVGNPTTTITYSVGTGGSSDTQGNPTYFKGTTTAAPVFADGGGQGGQGPSGTGGTAGSSAVGSSAGGPSDIAPRQGGAGGSGGAEGSTGGGGGGGAAGPDGNGQNGSGNGGSGGAGNGTGANTTTGGSPDADGNSGTQFGTGPNGPNGTNYGIGSGAGGSQTGTTGNLGGYYGGGGGGARSNSIPGSGTGGSGRQGLVYILYTPATRGFNIAMLGL